MIRSKVARWTRAAVFGAVTLAGAPSVRAHEFWLAPSSYRSDRGDTLEISALVGEGFQGVRSSFAADRTRSFRLLATSNLDLMRASMDGDSTYTRFIAPDRAGSIVAFESGFTEIELPADRFDRYLESEGLDAPRAARAKAGAGSRPGRERFARCAKTWIGGSSPRRGLEPAGLTLEIVPLAEPALGEALRSQVLYMGKPLEGALFNAWHQPLGHGLKPRPPGARDFREPPAQVRTDRDGIALVPITEPGEWLLSLVHMVPCPEPASADWQSYWASLTFAVIP